MRFLVFAFCVTAASTSLLAAQRRADETGRPETQLENPVVLKRGCQRWDLERLAIVPDAEGPFSLKSIDCFSFRNEDPILVSPDGKAAAAWHRYSPGLMEIAWFGQSRMSSMLNYVTFRNFLRTWPEGDAADVLAWSSGSDFLWSVRQKQLRGGFVGSGLAPIRINLDGTIIALPEFHHPTGPLEGIAWVDGSGLALGMFGGRGHAYQTRREGDGFTLAILDGGRGKILDEFAIYDIPGLKRSDGPIRVERGTTTLLADGRVRSVLQLSTWSNSSVNWWLVWTQGETPVLWPIPHTRESSHSFLDLSPDGSKLLVLRELPASAFYNDCAPGNNPPPTPATGPLAEYYDLGTRQLIWQTTATATASWLQRGGPVISPDGKYALLDLPGAACKRPIGVVELASGKIVQRLASLAVNQFHVRYGFTVGGDAWVSVGKAVIKYGRQ